MGKRTLQRHRGKGGQQYRAPSKGRFAVVGYPFLADDSTVEGTVLNIFHERGREYPIAQVEAAGKRCFIPAVSGLTIGSQIEIGPQAAVSQGNILPLSNIPEGTAICNIERYKGDGGRFVRNAGATATLFANSPLGAVIRLPSGKSITIP